MSINSENYPKMQKFSQLVRWVLITLLSFEGIPNAKIVQVCKQEHITSKYVSQFFQNNLHSIRKRHISLITRTNDLNHQVTKSFAKDCF